MGSRYLFEYRPVLRAKAVFDPPLEDGHLPRLIILPLPVKDQVEVPKKKIEGLFFLAMVMRGVCLAGEHDDQLFAVFAVDAIDDRRPAFFEFIDTIMMGQLELDPFR